MRARQRWRSIIFGMAICAAGPAWGAVVVTTQQITDGTDNTFTTVPLASSTDFLASAPGNSNGQSTGTNSNGASISASVADDNRFNVALSVLTDGSIATSADDPGHNYFNDNGAYTITTNLGRPVSIEQFDTYPVTPAIA
jgi:hypothetical protein